VITAAEERAFYDQQYAQFLALPDHALRIDRAVLDRNLNDPSNPFYERRVLYRATIAALESEPLRGRKVLDYGCGPADFGLWMATEGADVTLLDLSPAAIELGLRRARASGVEVRGVAADATKLAMFGDGEFDLVFACAALHHTLKYPGAVAELARIMRPGARLVLCETWGGNPLLNLARKFRARVAKEQEEQGEDIILDKSQLAALSPYFDRVRIDHYNLLAMSKRLLRGRLQNAWARAILGSIELIDRVLLAALPLKNWCGEAVIQARRMSL